jgi:hypothetical protein
MRNTSTWLDLCLRTSGTLIPEGRLTVTSWWLSWPMWHISWSEPIIILLKWRSIGMYWKESFYREYNFVFSVTYFKVTVQTRDTVMGAGRIAIAFTHVMLLKTWGTRASTSGQEEMTLGSESFKCRKHQASKQCLELAASEPHCLLALLLAASLASFLWC